MKKNKVFYRWIEVTDYAKTPKVHGEYSNKESRIYGKAMMVKMIIINKDIK